MNAIDTAIRAEFIKGLSFVPDKSRTRQVKSAAGVMTEPIRVKLTPNKVAKVGPVVQPAIRCLNSRVRTLAEHRATVDMMGRRYANGCDPLTNAELTGDDRDHAIKQSATFRPEPYTAKRVGTQDDNAGLLLLTEALRAV